MLCTRQLPALARRSVHKTARSARYAVALRACTRKLTPIELGFCGLTSTTSFIFLQPRGYTVPVITTKIKAPQCPTCGAVFQTEHVGAPGYLNQQKWRQVNQANVAKGFSPIPAENSDDVSEIPAMYVPGLRKRAVSDKTMLSGDQYKALVENIDDAELRAVFTGEKIQGFIDPNDMHTRMPKEYKESEVGTKALSFDSIIAARVRRRAEQGRDRIICQRCHSLKNYNRIDHPWKEDIASDPRLLKFLQYKSNILVVVVCDIFDIPGSLIPHLGDFISNRHPVILVANKADLLPKDYHEERLMMWFKRFSKSLDINIKSIHLISALKNLGTRKLAADITERRRAGQDVYMVGRANVGKSELINALLRISMGGSAHKVLASHIPGTTMGLYGIPMRRFVKSLVPIDGAPAQDRQASLYDTPGIFSNKSIISYLNNLELKMTVCQKRVKPLSFILGLGRSVMLGGLGRLDLVEGPTRVFVTIFSNIRPHFTRIERADELTKSMEAGKDTILKPPVGDVDRLKQFPHQKLAMEHEFEGLHKHHATLDVVFAGVGWIAITGLFERAKIKIYSPFGTGVGVRPPMMPFEYKLISPHTSITRKTPK
ncbi:nitric oxide associated protein 1 [Coemansia sp. RSA 1365]|nr:nitric oxide associated protein 1 [Coemansia sp. RSA 1365]